MPRKLFAKIQLDFWLDSPLMRKMPPADRGYYSDVWVRGVREGSAAIYNWQEVFAHLWSCRRSAAIGIMTRLAAYRHVTDRSWMAHQRAGNGAAASETASTVPGAAVAGRPGAMARSVESTIAKVLESHPAAVKNANTVVRTSGTRSRNRWVIFTQ